MQTFFLQALDYYLGHHRPDIVHGYSYWYQPADVAARYAQRRRVPFIFHPMYYHNAIRQKPTWRLYQQLYGRQTFAAADVVAVLSPYEQEQIERAGLPAQRFALLPPGIDTAAYQAARPNPFSARGITGPILLVVGRLSQEKAVDEVIRALPTIQKDQQGVQLVIIGEDFGALASLKTLAATLGIEKSVHFWGKADDELLRAAYQHAALLVHPSHYEAFGIVLAEAQAAGVPVVARKVAAIPYVVRHQETGLLFSTPDELVSHVLAVLKNEQQRKAFSEQAQHHIQEHFSWEATIARLLALYAELVPQKDHD